MHPTPPDTNIALFSSPSDLLYVLTDSTCTATCPYAYKVQTDSLSNPNAKVCVATCGSGFYLTKDASGVWFCDTQCKDSGTFFFTNNLGDKECIPTSNDTVGCAFTANAQRLSADYTSVTQMVYHIQLGSMRECKKTCNPGYYHTTNKLCLTDCSGSFFRERTRTIGENGVDQAANNYYVCTPNKCASDLFFRLESAGADNICMDSCASVSANSYSLEARLVVTNSGQNMRRCIQSCEADEVFVPEHNFNLSATYTPADFTIMKCMTACPTSPNGVSTSLIPKFVITNNHIADVPAA